MHVNLPASPHVVKHTPNPYTHTHSYISAFFLSASLSPNLSGSRNREVERDELVGVPWRCLFFFFFFFWKPVRSYE